MLAVSISPIRILLTAIGIWAFFRAVGDYRRRRANPNLTTAGSTRWLRVRLSAAVVMIGVILLLYVELFLAPDTVPLWMVSGPLVVAGIAGVLYLIASFAQGFSEG
jgi:hypothetical protein